MGSTFSKSSAREGQKFSELRGKHIQALERANNYEYLKEYEMDVAAGVVFEYAKEPFVDWCLGIPKAAPISDKGLLAKLEVKKVSLDAFTCGPAIFNRFGKDSLLLQKAHQLTVNDLVETPRSDINVRNFAISKQISKPVASIGLALMGGEDEILYRDSCFDEPFQEGSPCDDPNTVTADFLESCDTSELQAYLGYVAALLLLDIVIPLILSKGIPFLKSKLGF